MTPAERSRTALAPDTPLPDEASGVPAPAVAATPARVLAASAAAAVLALVIGLVLAGGAPEPAVPGLPDAGALTGWGLPLARLLFDLAAVGTVGVLLTGAVLVPARDGALAPPALRAVRAARVWATVWAVAALVGLLLSVSDTLGLPVGSLTASAVVEQSGSSRALARLAVAVLAVGIAVGAARASAPRAARVLLAVAVAALLPTTVTGHAASAADHDLAVTSVAVHVVAAALWVGGLAGLLVHVRTAPGLLAAAVPRFSALALAAFAVLTMSGVLAATARIGLSPDAWWSGYGGLLAAKSAGLLALGVIGWQHRRRLVPGLAAGSPRAFLALAGVEVVLMAATFGLATALSRSPMPAMTATPAVTPAHGAGHETLATDVAPVSALRLLTEWRLDALEIAIIGLALGLYVAGARAVRDRGGAWSPWRTGSAVAAAAVALYALCGGLATYAPAIISAHLAQFVLTALVVPALIVLAAPYALWRRVRVAALAGGEQPLPGRLAVALSDPFRGLLAFAALLFALYRTPLVEVSLRSFWVHLLVTAAALAIGTALLWAALATDDVPARRPVGERVLSLAAVAGLLLLLAAQLRYGDQLLAGRWFLELRWPWVDTGADQRLGAVFVAAGALLVAGLAVVAAVPPAGLQVRPAARPAQPASPTGPAGSPRPRRAPGRSPRSGSRRRP